MCVGPSPLELGGSLDLGRMFTGESLWLQASLFSLMTQLHLLPLLEFGQIVVLSLHPFLHIILLSLELNNHVPHLFSLLAQLRRLHAVHAERLHADGHGDLLLLSQLLAGLAQLALRGLDFGQLVTTFAAEFLHAIRGLHHGLPLLFNFFEAFSLGLLFGGLSLGLLFG